MITEKGMTAASYASSAGAMLAGLTLSEWGLIVGSTTAVLTWAGNMLFKYFDNQRKAEAHRLNIERIRNDRRQHDEPHEPERRRAGCPCGCDDEYESDE